MNEKATELIDMDRELLSRILKMEPRELEERHIAILKARRQYLTGDTIEYYDAVVNFDDKTEEVEEEAPKKKGKKK